MRSHPKKMTSTHARCGSSGGLLIYCYLQPPAFQFGLLNNLSQISFSDPLLRGKVAKELYKLGCAVTFSFCIFLQGVQCPETRGTVRALGDWSAEIS